MRLHILSDLHLEFDRQTGYLPPEVKADVLVLAGDIQVGTKFKWWFKHRTDEYEHVLYLPGNHEYYGGDLFEDLNAEYESWEKDLPGFTFLHNKHKVIDDVMFVGATLWTDFNKFSPITVQAVKESMNDYRLMRYSKFGKVTPDYIYNEHKKSLDIIADALEVDYTKKVVVTHHAPSFQSIHPRYYAYTHSNHGFYSALDHLVEKANLWIHGHTHSPMDYYINSCRVVANPRGYEQAGEITYYNPELVVEV
jgi:Icc-related predicted phosphoesterase